jgi:hypothetical protein
VNLRRAVIEAKLGRPLNSTEFVTYRCTNLYCLNPDHLQVVERIEIQRRSAAQGKFSSEKFRESQRRAAPLRLQSIRASLIKRLTPARIAEQRDLVRQGKPIKHAARDLGVAVPTMRLIIRGEIGGHLPSPNPLSSVFQWHRMDAA